MQTALKTVIDERPGPSPNAFNILMSRIEQEKQPSFKKTEKHTAPSLWESLQCGLRSIFEIQWVPALATFLIVGQSILVFSLLGGPTQTAGPGPDPIIPRGGIPQGKPHIPTIKVEIEFQDSATAHQIRELVKRWNGKITDGPSETGRFILTFPKTASPPMESLIKSLKDQNSLVRSVAPLKP